MERIDGGWYIFYNLFLGKIFAHSSTTSCWLHSDDLPNPLELRRSGNRYREQGTEGDSSVAADQTLILVMGQFCLGSAYKRRIPEQESPRDLSTFSKYQCGLFPEVFCFGDICH